VKDAVSFKGAAALLPAYCADVKLGKWPGF